MKNFTLLLTAAVVAAMSLQPVEVSAKSLFKPTNRARVTATSDSPKVLPASRVLPRAAGDIWMPGKVAEYTWIEDDSEWSLYNEKTFDYFGGGLVKSVGMKDEWQTTNSKYQYNDEGLLTHYTDSYFDESTQQFIPSNRRIYNYDYMLTRACVQMLYYTWNNNEWLDTEGEYAGIERNKDRNIVRVTQIISIGYKHYVNSRYDIEYGSDGKASKITMLGKESFYYDVFETECVLSDIVWDRTDGQILLVNYTPSVDIENPYDYEPSTYETGLFGPDNRVASFTMVSEDYGNVKLNVTVDYSESTFHVVAKTDAGKTYIDWEYNDLSGIDGHGPGSYESKQFEIDIDYDEDTDTHYEVEMLEYEKYYTDAYGLMLLDEEIQYEDGELDDYYKKVGTVEYDPTYGYPVSYVVTEEEDGEMYNEYKVVYSDYEQCSGITDVTVDSENAPVEYFNLQGVKMEGDNLAPGLYIRRQGAKAQKVLVK